MTGDRVRVYISGPMRGLPDFNYPMFHEVEAAWKEQHPDDVVLNPARNFDGDTSLPAETYFQKALEQVLSANFIVLLPGWEDSEGASQYEVPVARVTGKIFYQAMPVDECGWTDWRFQIIPAPQAKPSVLLGTETINGARIAAGVASFDLPAGSVLSTAQVDWPGTGFGSERASLLDEAKGLVAGDRNNSYGPPTQDFDRTAQMASAWGFQVGGEPLKSHHVAIFMILLKTSRLRWSPRKRDSWTDTAGYAACGVECAIEEGKQAG